MEEIRHEKQPIKPLKFRLIAEIYGWLIVLIGIGIFLMLVPAAIGNFYFEGVSVETAFNSVFLLIEGFGVGLGFIGFGTALRKFVIVQTVLFVIFLLITIWFVWFFSFYGNWSDVYKTLGLAVLIIAPLAVSVFANREEI